MMEEKKAEPLPKTYSEVRNEPPYETEVPATHQQKRPCSNANEINAKLSQLDERKLELVFKESFPDV
jgi:hypothetical protein